MTTLRGMLVGLIALATACSRDETRARAALAEAQAALANREYADALRCADHVIAIVDGRVNIPTARELLFDARLTRIQAMLHMHSTNQALEELDELLTDSPELIGEGTVGCLAYVLAETVAGDDDLDAKLLDAHSIIDRTAQRHPRHKRFYDAIERELHDPQALMGEPFVRTNCKFE